jgi:hypothetical protein
MFNNKILLSVLLIFTVFAFVGAQQSRSETTAEEDYLSTFEDMIINELTISDELDNKVLALQYIADALENDTGSRDLTQIQTSLSSLAGEGVLTQARTNGRLTNDYPQVRAEACRLLGMINSPESRDTLTKIALAEKESWVAASAIKSLGEISQDESDEAVATIAWVEKKYAVINPSSSLAFEILNAYEKLAPTVIDKSPLIQSISKIAVNYYYTTSVRDKAKALLKKYTGKK